MGLKASTPLYTWVRVDQPLEKIIEGWVALQPPDLLKLKGILETLEKDECFDMRGRQHPLYKSESEALEDDKHQGRRFSDHGWTVVQFTGSDIMRAARSL